MTSERFIITPENALPHVVLWQTYSVEEVARIAAACAGKSQQERIIAALKLLEAVENFANPYAPWLDQDASREEGDGLGDLPDNGDKIRLLTEAAEKIIKLATKNGKVSRKAVLQKSYAWAELVGAENAQNQAYTKWAKAAARECAKWTAWDEHVKKHPEDLTPGAGKAWEIKWGKGAGNKVHSHTEFLSHFELPMENGQAACFRNDNAALALLAGNKGRDYTPFLQHLKTLRRRTPLHSKKTGKIVSPSDRENKESRKRKIGDIETYEIMPRRKGKQSEEK